MTGNEGDLDSRAARDMAADLIRRSIQSVPLGLEDDKAVLKKDMTVEDLSRHREGTRRWLAAAIVGATVLLALLYGIAAIWADPVAWERAEGPTGAIFTAFVGLAGSAIGYYFAKSEK